LGVRTIFIFWANDYGEATEVELQNRGLDLAERFFEERPRDFGHRLGIWLQQWLRGEAPTVADALVCHDVSVLN